MVPRKSPNKDKMPMPSMRKPINRCFRRIKRIPPKKNNVGFIFVGLAKKYTVLVGPMIKTTPRTNKMLPIAKRLESKKVITPRRKRTTPAAVAPTPYSAVRRERKSYSLCKI